MFMYIKFLKYYAPHPSNTLISANIYYRLGHPILRESAYSLGVPKIKAV